MPRKNKKHKVTAPAAKDSSEAQTQYIRVADGKPTTTTGIWLEINKLVGNVIPRQAYQDEQNTETKPSASTVLTKGETSAYLAKSDEKIWDIFTNDSTQVLPDVGDLGDNLQPIAKRQLTVNPFILFPDHSLNVSGESQEQGKTLQLENPPEDFVDLTESPYRPG